MREITFDHIAKTIREVLQNQREVVFAYIFGSAVSGSTREGSDIDVAVYLLPEHQEQFFDIRLKLMEQLTRSQSREVDVVILNTAPPFLAYVVLKEGRRCFERDRGARIDFELNALNAYFDYKPVLERYHSHLRNPV